jgi:hypothetical protein
MPASSGAWLVCSTLIANVSLEVPAPSLALTLMPGYSPAWKRFGFQLSTPVRASSVAPGGRWAAEKVTASPSASGACSASVKSSPSRACCGPTGSSTGAAFVSRTTSAMVSWSLPTGPAPALPLSVTAKRIEYAPRSAAVGVHSKSAVPYALPGVSVAPGGSASALKLRSSWSRSDARSVKRSVWPTSATLLPTGASSGGSLGESAEITKLREVLSTLFAPPPSPLSLAVSFTT